MRESLGSNYPLGYRLQTPLNVVVTKAVNPRVQISNFLFKDVGQIIQFMNT